MYPVRIYFTRIFSILAIILLTLGIFTFVCVKKSQAATGINRTINFQGKLVNNPAKTNVSNTSYTVIFTLYNNPSGGTALWTETQTVNTADGIFRVNLGSVTPFASDFNFNWDGLYLGMKVNSDSEMTPRVTLSAVPYAFNSEKVSGLTVQDDSGNASTSGTLQVGNAKTVKFAGSNGLTFNDPGGSTTITFPATGSITLLDLSTSQILTNKSIGSTGLTFSGATTDITTGTNEDLVIAPNGTGRLGINASSPLAGVDIRSSINTLAVASISGTTPFAAFLIDQRGAGDLFTASKSGVSLFSLNNNGGIKLGLLEGSVGNCLLSGGAGNADSWGSCGGGSGTNYWQLAAGGVLAPGNLTQDVLFGSTATSSAKFSFLNSGSTSLGTPTASISGSSGNIATYLTGLGQLGTTNRQDLVLGNSSINNSTGNIFLQPLGIGNVGIGTATPSAAFRLEVGNNDNVNELVAVRSKASAGIELLADTTNNPAAEAGNPYLFLSMDGGQNTGIVGLSQSANVDSRGNAYTNAVSNGMLIGTTGNAALSFGVNGATQWHMRIDGTIIHGGSNTPLASLDLRNINAHTPIASLSGSVTAASLLVDQSGAGAIFAASKSGATKFVINNNGNLQFAGTTNFLSTIASAATGAQTWTLPDATGTLCLQSSSSCGFGLGTNWWTTSTDGKALAQTNTTQDLLIGGIATTSAKFAVLNTAAALTPVASLSATTASGGSGNGVVLDAGGSIQSLRNNSLTLGGATTGNIILSPLNSVAGGSVNPGADNLVSLGASNSARFKDLFLGAGSLHVQCTTGDGCGAGGLDYAMGVNTTTGTLSIGVNGATSVGNPILNITQGGKIGIGNTVPVGLLDLNGRVIGKAMAIFNETGNQDIFTASASGTTRFSIANNGDLKLTAGFSIGGSVGTVTDCLKGGAAVSWGSCSTGGSSNWTLNTSTGVIRPNNNTLDLILGGIATSSAKFQFTNMISGNPTLKIFDLTSVKSLNLYHDGTNGYVNTSAGELILGTGAGNIIIENALLNDTVNNSGALKIEDKLLVQNTENALALVVFNNLGAGDLFTASAGGATKFTLKNDGSATMSGGLTFDSAASIQTTKMQGLTIGGNTTGNISLQANNSGTGIIQVGTGGSGSTTPDLFGLDVKSDTGDPTGFEGAMYYNTSDNKFRCYEGAAWKDCDTNTGPTTKYLTADHANSTTTGTKVTSLDTTLAPGTYTFRYSLIVQSATTTVGPMFGINFSTGTAAVHTFAMHWADNSTALTAYADGMDDQGTKGVGVIAGMASKTFTTTAPDMGTTVGVSTINSNTPAWIDGIIVVTVQGNLELWHSSETATSTTLMANSSLVITPISAGADLAEIYGTKDMSMGAGDVVSLDASLHAGVKKSDKPYDRNAFGIISTKPSLTMGTLDDPDTTPVLVAFSGRVPVKVSTENGFIKPGDYLTASSTPGVAMKATKSGQIIGQAMTGYSGEKVGKILAFVKTSFSQGDTKDVSSLEYLISNKDSIKTEDLSGIFTDKVVAGLEVITPKITADEIHVRNLKADHIDLPADFWQQARQAGGLEIVSSDNNTRDIALLKDQILNLSNIVKTATESAKTSSESAVFENSSQELLNRLLARDLESASMSATASSNSLLTTIDSDVDGLTLVSGNLRVKGNGLIEGILTVVDALKANDLIVNGVATFFGDTILKGNVNITGSTTFGNDIGGQAVIKKGLDRVEIVFDKEYEENPVVNASISFDEKKDKFGNPIDSTDLEQKYFKEGYSYIIVNKSTKGFVIVLNKKSKDDINFTWTALRVKDAKTVQGMALTN